MATFDLNDLELSDQSRGTLSSYKYVAYSLNDRKYNSYINRKTKYKMQTIGKFDDVREAAFVAQQFNSTYTPGQVEDMLKGETFKEVCEKFIDNLDIPEFKYPPEGYTIEDYLNDNTKVKEKLCRCDCAQSALRYVIKQNNLIPPCLNTAKKLIKKTSICYGKTNNWIKAAEQVMGV